MQICWKWSDSDNENDGSDSTVCMSVSGTLSHLILTIITYIYKIISPWGRYYYYPYLKKTVIIFKEVSTCCFFLNARQALYHLCYAPSPFVFETGTP
jgi:hypothetical protein